MATSSGPSWPGTWKAGWASSAENAGTTTSIPTWRSAHGRLRRTLLSTRPTACWETAGLRLPSCFRGGECRLRCAAMGGSEPCSLPELGEGLREGCAPTQPRDVQTHNSTTNLASGPLVPQPDPSHWNKDPDLVLSSYQLNIEQHFATL